MADKFPALDGAESNVPVDEKNEDFEGDFLSREKELVGDEFKTDQDQNVLAESDDELNDFKQRYQEVGDYERQQEEPAEPEVEDKEVGSPDAPGMDLSGSNHIAAWKERRDLESSEREKVNEKKKEAIIAEARQTIDDFYENYNNKKEQHSKDLLKEQEQFLEKRDNFLSKGTLWDRVNLLVDEIGEIPGDATRDKSRFKGLLQKLKGNEGVPGASGY